MIKISPTKMKACCTEMKDGMVRGVFIIRENDDMVFSEGCGLFYKALRFCPSCGEATTIIRGGV